MSWDWIDSRYAAAGTEALVHFVWQGVVLAFAGYAALRSAAQPRTRYAIACVTLILMALAPILTVALNVRDVPAAVAGRTGFSLSRTNFSLSRTNFSLSDSPATAAVASGAIDWRRFVLPLWLAGVVILAIRTAGGWTLALRRVRHGRVRATQEIEDAVRALALRLGVQRAVRVFASATTAVPTVFGWIRPVLLVPASAITGLGPDELRAILAHEVAHIARHDFAVNCLQSAVEVLLFYHPAVWWISRRIREEREMCCDAAAVEICGDPRSYSCALLSLEESRQRFVLAANGGSLKNRIERMLIRREPVSSLGAAVTGVLAAVGCAVAIGAVPVIAMPPVPPLPMPALAAVATAAPPLPLPLPAPTVRRTAEVQIAYAPPPQNEAPPPKPEMQQYSTVKKASRPGIPAAARRPVLFIMSREQQDLFVLLPDDAARDRFAEQFWASRPAEERVEHERRVRFADAKYDGWDTTRGRTYIKEGPPDEIESRPGEFWEIWTYKATGQKYTFAGEGYGMVTIESGGGRMSGLVTRAGGPPDDEGEIATVSVRDNSGKELAGVTPGARPYYPMLARRARIQGDVVLRGSAGPDGKVLSINVVSGHPLLVQAAQSAVRTWTFPAATQFEATLRFTLKAR